MNIQTGRDPFARHTVRKRKAENASCKWCGSKSCGRGSFVWTYFVDADSPRESGDIGEFCSISCLNSYQS